MKKLDLLAATLLIVGGLNWGLVALAEFDLVAWIFGEEFGSTNAASRLVYGLVGLAAVYGIASLLASRNPRCRRPPGDEHTLGPNLPERSSPMRSIRIALAVVSLRLCPSPAAHPPLLGRPGRRRRLTSCRRPSAPATSRRSPSC